jgi:hypothetical protein
MNYLKCRLNNNFLLINLKVGFMRGICIPCYELLADVIPEAEKLRERSRLNFNFKNIFKLI